MGFCVLPERHANVLNEVCCWKNQFRSDNPDILFALDKVDHGRDAVWLKNEISIKLDNDLALGNVKRTIHRNRVSKILIVAETQYFARSRNLRYSIENRLS